MGISTTWKSGLIFEGQASDSRILISPDKPEQGSSLGPDDLLLLALAGSSGIEVMKRILTSGEKVDSFEVKAEAKFKDKNGIPILTHVDLIFGFNGICKAIVVINAVEHSEFISCGISAILSRVLTIGWKVILNGENIAEGVADYDYSLNG